jgi:hypothetical protein
MRPLDAPGGADQEWPMGVGRVVAGATIVGALGVAAVGAVTAATAVKPAPRPAHGAAPWPAPAGALRLTRAAGLRPERREMLAFHVHAHLDVFVNGRRVVVPAGIGINIKDPGVKVFDVPDGSKAYGGISLCAMPCISPLHTHDDTGILHTESATPVPNRLGQFFTEWGVRLSRACVGGYCRPDSIEFYVNGKRYRGDPRAIQLADRTEIAIVIGTPPKKIPKAADISQA